MKRPLLIVSAAILSCGLAVPAFAQMATGENVPMPRTHHAVNPESGVTEYGEHHPYVTDFDSYLDAHPEEASELNKHPDLVRNPKYLANHPDLEGYLKANPKVASEYEHHPHHFMHRERHYERAEKRWDKRHHVPNN